MVIITKLCSGECGLELPNTEEYFSVKKTISGLKIYVYLNKMCKKCRVKKEQKRYFSNHENKLIYHKNYYKNNIDKTKLSLNTETTKETKRKWRLKNKDRILKNGSIRKKENHRKDPRKLLLYLAKRRAKEKNLQFSITIDDITVPDICPVLGIPIFVGEGKSCPNSPSIDRIDNNKGYIKGNVVIVSLRANNLKSNASLEEMGKIYNFYRNLLSENIT